MKKERTQAQIAADAKRTGRPRLPASKKRDVVLPVRMTHAERQKFKQMARESGKSISFVVMQPWREKGTL